MEKGFFIFIAFFLVVPLLFGQLLGTPTAYAQTVADGDLIRTEGAFDIYIVKLIGEKKFKRLILNPVIFESYGHLRWEDVRNVSQATVDDYITSTLVIEVNADGSVRDPKVYVINSIADSDVGERRHINITPAEFEAAGLDWDSLYKINHTEASPDFYPTQNALTAADNVYTWATDVRGGLSVTQKQEEDIIEWKYRQNRWETNVTPPACPEPLQLVTPTDLTLVTSVLYPGQYRGGDYKPHGGFRYDNSQSDDITIIAPMDARVVDGNRMLANGEIQYMFDLIAPCGIWYRFGHLRELSPKFAAIAETLPEATEGNSHTYEFDAVVTVTSGETIATAVGTKNDNNIGVDWGVYDIRSKNRASEDPLWAALHPGGQEQHGVCWFGFLSPEDEKIVRSLPPTDGVSGATSDYCL